MTYSINGVNTTFNLTGKDGNGNSIELSAVDVRKQVGGIGTRQVFAHMTPWFHVTQSSPTYPIPNGTNKYVSFDNHPQIGYNSNDTTIVASQLADIKRRGFNGFVIDWYGPTADGAEGSNPGNVEDKTVGAVRDGIYPNYCPNNNCSLHYSIVEDQGAWTRNNPAIPSYPQCYEGTGHGNQDSCIEAHVGADFSYIGSNYSNSGNSSQDGYYTVSSNGLQSPVLQFFISDGSGDTTWSVSSWTAIWSQAYRQAAVLGSSAKLIFRGSGGFTHYGYTDGSFAWFSFSAPDPDWVTNKGVLKQFYDTASAHQNLEIWGAGYKGFDERTDPTRPAMRYINQKCGSIWVQSLQAIAAPNNLDPNLQNFAVPFVVLPTWNDYGEGTEIESGVDNCVSAVNTAWDPVTPHQVDFSPTISDCTNFTEKTISGYDVFAKVTNPGAPLVYQGTVTPQYQQNPPSGCNYAYTYNTTNVNDGMGHYCVRDSLDCWLFVKAVGINSVKNVESMGEVDVHPALGTVTISGNEQKMLYCPVLVPPPGGNQPTLPPNSNCNYIYDSGSITVTVNGMTKHVGYQQGSTATTIAAALASAMNSDPNMPATVTVSNTVISLREKTSGGGNQPLSWSCTFDSNDFPFASFRAAVSGMAGGEG